MNTSERVKQLLIKGLDNKTIRQILTEEGLNTNYDIAAARYRMFKRGKKSVSDDYCGKYDKPILVFSDTHIPFNHKHYLKFLQDIDHKFNCAEQKICTGDLVDNHAISRHETEDGAMSPEAEYDETLNTVRKYTQAFPKVKLCIGNHDLIPNRLAKQLGLPYKFLKSYSQAWELPDTWEVEVDHYYKDVLYTHGINCGGVTGVRNTAIKENISTVIGHYHSHACVHYVANKSKMIFGANAGCGIDTHSYAFEYGRHFKDKPTIGCIVVFSPTWAMYIPMDIDYYNNKYGK